MLTAVLSFVLAGVFLLAGVPGAGPPEPGPATTTTMAIPDSPAAGLSLQAEPNRTGPAGLVPYRPIPVPPARGAGTALAAMVAGMALLAGRARRISTAERTIRASLQDNLFSDVGREDLERITGVMVELDAGEAGAVIASLSDHELGVWMRELDGWMGGLNDEEQVRLFRSLAGRLDARQLNRLVVAAGNDRLFDTILGGSPPAVRVRLATLLWASQTPANHHWGRAIDLLDGVPIPTVEAGLSHARLEQLSEDLLGLHEVGPDGAVRVRLDAMADFIGLAARLADPRRKALLFVEVAGQAMAHRSIPAVGETEYEHVLGRLASLLRSDPGAIIGLMNHDIDPHGNVFSEWIREMIEADRIDELDVLLVGLIGGDRRLDHFADPGADPAFPYPNAANLGYYIGSYSLAIDAIADDAADRVNLVGRLFSIVTGVVPGPGNSKVRLPLGPLVDAHAESVIDGMRDDASSLKQTLWGLAKPRTGSGLLWNGPGTTQFQDAWEEVVLVR